MKTFFTLTFLLFTITIAASPGRVYDRLCEVNKCWKLQNDVAQLEYPEYTDMHDREWIRTHLALVEQTLRARSTNHLTVQQRANREQSLNDLHAYMLSGRFPINDLYHYRTPIFIDRYDNFCAVGHLVKASGHEDVSRMIAADNNLAYVYDMNYPELLAWANEYGFTVDELAWIQPGYQFMEHAFARPIGKGTDGTVFELCANATDDKLYVGGSFKMVDSTITANNIAYLAESGGTYTWHSMGSGVNGPVYAIVEFDNKIYVAGDFDTAGGIAAANIAYWDGNSWNASGCTYGHVNDLVVFENELYAVGDFDVCAALPEVNFAKWDTTYNYWQQMQILPGHVNTIEAIDTTLYLGGRFTFQSQDVGAIKWSKNAGFSTFANSPENEVTDFAVFRNEVYATSRQTDTTLTDTLLHKLDGNTWISAGYQSFYNFGSPFPGMNTYPAYNTMCVDNDTLMIGGKFYHSTFGPVVLCNRKFGPGGKIDDFWVDSTIHKMVFFKNRIISGGAFKASGQTTLNSICWRELNKFSGVNEINTGEIQFSIAPNPTTSGGTIFISNNFNATSFRLYSIEGKQVLRHNLDNKQEAAIPALPPGVYIAELQNEQGLKATQRLIIK